MWRRENQETAYWRKSDEGIIPEIKQEKQEIEAEKAKPLSLQLVKVPESVAKVNVLNERGDLVYSMDAM